MDRSKKTVVALVVLGVLALVAWPVYAHCGKCAGSAKDMVKAMDTGKVTLGSATSAAEAHSKGKAVASMAGMNGGKLEFAVYCLVGDKLQDVTVDSTGKATTMADAKMLPHEDHPEHGESKPGH